MTHETMITKLTKGQQITIPSLIREKLNLQPGSRVELELRENEVVIRPIGSDIEEFFERSQKVKARRHLTADQMDELVEDEMHCPG